MRWDKSWDSEPEGSLSFCVPGSRAIDSPPRKFACAQIGRAHAGLPRAPADIGESTGRPLRENSFRNAWADATRPAGIAGLTFDGNGEAGKGEDSARHHC
jgi:hypothetical protein